MASFIWIAIIAIFVAHLAIVAVIIQRFRRKSASLQMQKVQEHSTSSAYKLHVKGRKYFFEKETKGFPLYELYCEVKQFDINIFSSDAISCDADEISDLLDSIDPIKGGFFLVIVDKEQNRTLQFQCELPGRIEADLWDNGTEYDHSGVLPFASDMKHLFFDFFSGKNVISGYSLKPRDI